jgi:hypothetical protein
MATRKVNNAMATNVLDILKTDRGARTGKSVVVTFDDELRTAINAVQASTGASKRIICETLIRAGLIQLGHDVSPEPADKAGGDED